MLQSKCESKLTLTSISPTWRIFRRRQWIFAIVNYWPWHLIKVIIHLKGSSIVIRKLNTSKQLTFTGITMRLSALTATWLSTGDKTAFCVTKLLDGHWREKIMRWKFRSQKVFAYLWTLVTSIFALSNLIADVINLWGGGRNLITISINHHEFLSLTAMHSLLVWHWNWNLPHGDFTVDAVLVLVTSANLTPSGGIVDVDGAIVFSDDLKETAGEWMSMHVKCGGFQNTSQFHARGLSRDFMSAKNFLGMLNFFLA